MSLKQDGVIFKIRYNMVVNLDCNLFSIVSNLNKSNLKHIMQSLLFNR